jgi:uncharacterized membrane protein
MSPTTKKLRVLSLSSYFLLLFWVTYWHFYLSTAEQEYSVTFIVLLYIVPLLLPMPGLLKGKPYTHAWANFIALYYLIHACTVIYAIPAERLYGMIELGLVCALFIGCSMFARYRGRELGLGLSKLKDEMKAEKEIFKGK